MGLTGAQIVAQARLEAVDTDADSANQGLQLSQWVSVVNAAHFELYVLLYPNRMVWDGNLVGDLGPSTTTRRTVTTLATFYEIHSIELGPETVSAGIADVTEASGTALEMPDWAEVRYLLDSRPAAASVLTRCAARQPLQVPAGGANAGKFAILLYPPLVVPAALKRRLGGYVRIVPDAIVGSSEIPDYDVPECYGLARIAAVRGLMLNGDADLAIALAKQVPPIMQPLVANLDRFRKPRVDPMESPA